MPQRITLSRRKGWRLPAGAVKVDRSTRWGNPFRAGQGVSAAATVARFSRWLRNTKEGTHLAAEAHLLLGGKDLACWCPPGAPCHADVLLAISNAPPSSAPDR